MKQVSQLDQNGYFISVTIADESPLEPGVFLIPGNAVDVEPPIVPENKRAKWNGAWVLEDIPPPEVEPEIEPVELTYFQKRYMEYPSVREYLDGIVKGDQVQIDKYIADCLAVKAKYPKPE
jgi:hypothetical protein